MVLKNLQHSGNGRNSDDSPADLFSKAWDAKERLDRALSKALANVPPIGPDDPRAPELVAEIARRAVVYYRDRYQDQFAIATALAEWSGKPIGEWRGSVIRAAEAVSVAGFKSAYGHEQNEDGPPAVVTGLVREGEPFQIAAVAKTGKTFTVADLTAAVLTGTKFIGYTVPAPRPVLTITAETNPAEFRSKVQRAVNVRVSDERARQAAMGNLLVTGDVSLVRKRDERQLLRRFINDTGTGLVVLDPLYLIAPPRVTTNLTAAGGMLRMLVEPIVGAGAAVAIVHHLTKAVEIGDWPDLSELSGAGVAEFARSWLLLNRAEPYRGPVNDLLAVAGTSAGDYARLRLTMDESAGTLTATSEAEADRPRSTGRKVPDYLKPKQKGG